MARHTSCEAGKSLAEQAADYIRDHSEKKFSLSEIAGELYINGNYLARLFKKETGHTLLWYHNAVRCEKGAQLLRDTEESVSEIGEKLGYVSTAHFSHVFTKMKGCSPSQYRKNSRQEEK